MLALVVVEVKGNVLELVNGCERWVTFVVLAPFHRRVADQPGSGLSSHVSRSLLTN